MLTIRALDSEIQKFIHSVSEHGIDLTRVWLFGSYAGGNPNENSDVDLAIWSPQFTGERIMDWGKLLSAMSKHPKIEPHTFPPDAKVADFPFLEEIFETGKAITFSSHYDGIDQKKSA